MNKEATVSVDAAAERILFNFAAFDVHVRRAQQYYGENNLEAAPISAALAAHVATSTHCGIFWSPRLERLLNAIGQRIDDGFAANWDRISKGQYKNVLHVCTYLYPSGGVARMLSRWISADQSRTHSIALTQHRGPIPEHSSKAVTQSGGRIYQVNRGIGGIFHWVRELRRVARRHDLLVLHIHCEDVIPLLAFARTEKFPPALLLNHADHLFWFGSSISHAVINLRDAAKDLAESRRGIDDDRNLLMPTIVDDTVRMRSRSEAKQALGLDPRRIILVSVARAAKYRTMNGVTYADLHVPSLLEHTNAELVVVGAHSRDDWRQAIAAVGGRIRPLPHQSDPRPYYEAADIYVDSYPFVSSTSMMEAAGYGLPLVTIFKAPETARILGINHVGLVGNALVARSDVEYAGMLSRLISDGTFRAQWGEAARDAIVKNHTPSGWLPRLEEIYARSKELPPLDSNAMLSGDVEEFPFFDELDRRHEEMFRSDYPLSGHLRTYMGMVSMKQRWAYWKELRREGAFENWWQGSACLLPIWFKRLLKDR
jgi:Glycosyl transferases group 1